MLNGVPPHMTTPGKDDTFAEVKPKAWTARNAYRGADSRGTGTREVRTADFLGSVEPAPNGAARLDWPPTNR